MSSIIFESRMARFRNFLCIFIEGKIKAIQLVNARVIVQTVLLSFFSVFIFSMPSKLTQTHFSPRLAARAKMNLSRAQNIFMPANINSIVILYIYHMKPIESTSAWFHRLKLDPKLDFN